MINRIAFAASASVTLGFVTYMLKSDVDFMLGSWVAFAISAMYMPDRKD